MRLSTTAHSLMRYVLRQPRAGAPLRACLTITDRCNLRCQSCSIWKRDQHADNELSREEWINVVDQCLEMGVTIFYIFGGEPLLRKEFYDIVRHVSRERGLFSETVTNGTPITEQVANRIMESGLNKIWVSLDGPPEVHDLFRGVPGSFDRALAGLDHLLAAKKRTNHPILVDLAVTVSALNYRQIPDLVRLVRDRELYEINIRHMGVFFQEDVDNLNQVIGAPFGKTFYKESLCFSDGTSILLNPAQAREFREILEETRQLCEEAGVPLHCEPDLMRVEDWRQGKKIDSCLHLWTQINVDAQGEVIPCIWFDKVTMGNVRQTPLKEIWNNAMAQHIRAHFNELTACSKCCYFYLNLTDNFKRALQVANFPFSSLIR